MDVALVSRQVGGVGVRSAHFSYSSAEGAKKNELKPHLKRQWCLGELTTTFLWRMEDVLAVYERPYDPRHPLICFDERPCQLIGDVVAPLPMEPGKPVREDYHSRRNGVCSLFLAFDPHRKRRSIQVRERRTKCDYAVFRKALVEEHYPEAEQSTLVQDNLNPHTPGSFYQAFSPEEAFALTQRFELHYTPPHASWLNMAEIELAALSKQCLDRRIPDRDTLAREAAAWQEARNQQGATVSWQFTTEKARDKFKKHYPGNTQQN